MTKSEIQEKIRQMQTPKKGLGKIWQNPNGTWSHHHDGQREWSDKAGCLTDLRFSEDYYRDRI